MMMMMHVMVVSGDADEEKEDIVAMKWETVVRSSSRQCDVSLSYYYLPS